MDNPETRANKR